MRRLLATLATASVSVLVVSTMSCSSDNTPIIGAPMAGAANMAGAASAGAPSTSAGSGNVAGSMATGGAQTSMGGAAAGSGGAAIGGNPGTAGAAGSAAAGMASTDICDVSGAQFNCNNVLKAPDGMGMDGYLSRDDSAGPSQGSDAPQIGCTPSDAIGKQTIYKEKHWQLTGPNITPGAKYKVNLHFWGIVECKTYTGGTGPSKTDPNETPNVNQSHNLWLAGAADNGDHWNTYTFSVTPNPMSTLTGIGPQNVPVPPKEQMYSINQCPGNKGEGHFTWKIDFDSSIEVPGGSYINYIEYDTNCRMIANCGASDAGQSCNGPYNVVDTVKNAVPNTNAGFTQPIVNTANPPSRGQWWLVDVTSIKAL